MRLLDCALFPKRRFSSLNFSRCYILFLFQISDGSFFGGGAAAHRRCLDSSLVTNNLLNSDSLTEALKWVIPLEPLKFYWGVLIEELVDGEVTAIDLDLDLASLDLNHNAT